jgi:hypothetical protein
MIKHSAGPTPSPKGELNGVNQRLHLHGQNEKQSGIGDGPSGQTPGVFNAILTQLKFGVQFFIHSLISSGYWVKS